MAKEPTTAPVKTEFSPEQIMQFTVWANSPAGQATIRQQEKIKSIKEPHSKEEIEKFLRMAERNDVRYVRIDPETQKEHREAKEFFWRIVNAVPQVPGVMGAHADCEHFRGAIRIQFLIQKYHRDPKLMYEANVLVGDGTSAKQKKHMAYSDRDEEQQLIAPGDRIIDATEFMAQFKKEEDAE